MCLRIMLNFCQEKKKLILFKKKLSCYLTSDFVIWYSNDIGQYNNLYFNFLDVKGVGIL